MDKNIIWIASYPKSGNTWIRSVLSSLFYTDDGNFNFNTLKKINTFDRPFYFDEVTKEKKISTYDLTTLAKIRIEAQKIFNKKNTLKFFKTHAANIKIDGYDYTNQETTRCAIYIVRDPRDVLVSWFYEVTKRSRGDNSIINTQKTNSVSDFITNEKASILTIYLINFKF